MLADNDRWYWFRIPPEGQSKLIRAFLSEDYPVVCRVIMEHHASPEKVAMCCGLGEALGRVARAIENKWITDDTPQ